MTNIGYYLVITIVLLEVGNCSVFGNKYFRNGKLWKKTGPPVRDSEDKWIEQKLDHFDSNEKRTWQQRYSVNEDLVNHDRNVAFLNIVTDSIVDIYEIPFTAMYSYAQKFQPILFSLEHRYYGYSRPTTNVSTENLKYLSSKQALADLAVFIKSMSKQYNLSPDVKWIVFGTEYSGSLAAWARLLYPNLVHGAVSSCAPLLAKVDFYEYFMVVEDALRASNEKCPDILQEGYKQLEEHLNDAKNRQKLNDIFNLCHDIETQIDNHLNLATFFLQIANVFAYIVQYNNGLNFDTNHLCNTLLDETLGSEINRLGAIWTYNYHNCLDTDYDAMLDKSNDGYNGDRQWFYQTCTEFGFYQTSSHDPHIFGNRFDVDYFIQQCIDMYGPEFNKTFVENAAAATNNLYQGLDINVTNTVFIHGSLDPWHPLGIYQSRSEDSPAILLDGASHCTDVHKPTPYDSEQLKAARAKIEELILKWLKN